MPLITIGMPVYKGGRNDGRLLIRALDSLTKQTFKDFQVLISDNDSQDYTAKIVRQYLKSDDRFKYLKNPVNLGPYYNLARLVTACESKYYLELHFDSYLAPTFLEECLNILEADPAVAIAYSHCQFVDDEGNPLDLYKDAFNFAHEDPGRRYLSVLAGMGWCTAFHGLWRHETLAGHYFNSVGRRNAAMDNEFLALAALRGKLVQIPKPLFSRLKDDYQRKEETIPARFDRLYFKGAFRNPAPHFLPFCTWIRDHCQDLLAADLPLDQKDELVHQTVSILLKRYKHMVDFELGRAVDLVLKGEFKKGLAGPEEAPPPKGQFKYLDFVYLAQLVMDLEYASALRPDFPKLALARAVVRLDLGQQTEALAALEAASRLDPAAPEVQELKTNLQEMRNRAETTSGAS